LETTGLEEVPLTDQEKTDIAEAWLGYLHSLPDGAEPDLHANRRPGLFTQIVNQILAAHDFEPFTATFGWGPEQELVLLARRLPISQPLE
jgi:hypothetical protein